MRRNKPRQHGVREARPAGGAGPTGWAGAGPVVPAQVREAAGRDALPSCRHPLPCGQLSTGTFLQTPAAVFTHGSAGERFCLLPGCLSLGRRRVPGVGGSAAWGHRGGLGRDGEAFPCFRGNRRAPLPPSRAAARTFRGPSPDDTQKAIAGNFGAPVVLQREVRTVGEPCVQLWPLCVYVWEGAGCGQGCFGWGGATWGGRAVQSLFC